MSFAQGAWTAIPLPPKPGEVVHPWALAVDAAGDLYVAEGYSYPARPILKRDSQGNWSTIAIQGADSQVLDITLDTTGNLYVVRRISSYVSQVEKRDLQGN
jgi:hypothetical protein